MAFDKGGDGGVAVAQAVVVGVSAGLLWQSRRGIRSRESWE